MIRRIKTNEHEVDRIMEIWKEATIEAHKFISEEYWLKSYKIVKEKYLPLAETYVYSEGSEIKGFISILSGAYIGALFVVRDAQGDGIGRKLIEYVKGKYETLTLAVYKENKKAVHFYKKVGFVFKHEQLNEETNEPEYIMSFKSSIL
ncbi:N-acetyltransferase [Cellulosilyticum sp. I15G10I2]|uniref:N-acetyltransferase n=1 Tax=Cellulosilyticum sp. I15G10I2 TaxID=1892843 RepID=UPI00085BFECF|nr:N-acetyltransferase [Cellulosilyticum sp. I15G10I2]